jgi:hypothetical protein
VKFQPNNPNYQIMNNNLFSIVRLSRARLAAFVALASVPLTAYAIYDSYGEFYNYVSVGYNSSSSSSSSSSNNGVLLVGYYNAMASSSGSSSSSGSMAVGSYNVIYDRGSVVIGTWNKNTNGDELLILGNGTYSVPSNAMEVFKNGNVNVQGAITCAAGGDIPMYGE